MNKQKVFTPLETMAVRIPVQDNKSFLTGFTPLESKATMIILRGKGKFLTGFTLVELLTSIVIIVLLLGLLLPSLAKIRRSAKEAAQKVQFATIDTALEAFKQDYGDYPPSNQIDGAGSAFAYCGTEKLAEALLGWDLRGFHPKTAWSRNGYDPVAAVQVYTSTDPNLRDRKGPYLDVAKTPVFRLGTSSPGANNGLYNYNNPNFFNAFDRDANNFVICDVFGVKKINASGKIVNAGTPILYYKANTSSKAFYCDCTPIKLCTDSIYNYYDNLPLLSLNMLPNATEPHKIMTPPPPIGRYFCSPEYRIVDSKVSPLGVSTYWPNRPDSYILISAGADHNFGTNDDILNF